MNHGKNGTMTFAAENDNAMSSCKASKSNGSLEKGWRGQDPSVRVSAWSGDLLKDNDLSNKSKIIVLKT